MFPTYDITMEVICYHHTKGVNVKTTKPSNLLSGAAIPVNDSQTEETMPGWKSATKEEGELWLKFTDRTPNMSEESFKQTIDEVVKELRSQGWIVRRHGIDVFAKRPQVEA